MQMHGELWVVSPMPNSSLLPSFYMPYHSCDEISQAEWPKVCRVKGYNIIIAHAAAKPVEAASCLQESV